MKSASISRRKISLLAVACVCAAATFACTKNDSAAVDPAPKVVSEQISEPVEEQSLYDKYGGLPAIQAIVDDTVAAALADPDIAPYFAVIGQPGYDTEDQLKSCLDLQFTVLLGGPGEYPGTSTYRNAPPEGYNCRDMESSHAGLNISGDAFDEFIAILVTAMSDAGVSEEDLATLTPQLEALRGSIEEEGPSASPSPAPSPSTTQEQGQEQSQEPGGEQGQEPGGEQGQTPGGEQGQGEGQSKGQGKQSEHQQGQHQGQQQGQEQEQAQESGTTRQEESYEESYDESSDTSEEAYDESSEESYEESSDEANGTPTEESYDESSDESDSVASDEADEGASEESDEVASEEPSDESSEEPSEQPSEQPTEESSGETSGAY